jgi:hypothetical protein
MALYEDEYVRLDNTEIHIKRYYFPFASAKKLAYSEIADFGTAERMGIDFWGMKGWGMGFSSIWWAIGPTNRAFKPAEQIVIKPRGASIFCGFSTHNVQEVMRILADKASAEQIRLLQGF